MASLSRRDFVKCMAVLPIVSISSPNTVVLADNVISGFTATAELAVDKNILVYDQDASPGRFSERLVRLMNEVMENSREYLVIVPDLEPGKLTDVYAGTSLHMMEIIDNVLRVQDSIPGFSYIPDMDKIISEYGGITEKNDKHFILFKYENAVLLGSY